MDPGQFVEALSKLKFENSFNPYSNRCVVHDLDDAPQRRLQTRFFSTSALMLWR